MKKAPSPLVSLIPIVVLVLLLFATIRTFGSDALSGGSQVSLLTTTAICILIGMVFYKIPWKDYELAITNNIAGVATAIIILLIIGALSGIWMISGVVPTLIYYGMQIIHPSFFLASTCIICALISVMTGSSWTTIATIGIALMGVSNLLNKKSGVLGISGVSSDMRELLAACAAGNEKAILAEKMYYYRIKKYIGAYAAALGGVDIILFTGGVGENQMECRREVCKDMEFMGIELDNEVNAKVRGEEAIISTPASKVKVVVIPTDEELLIASDTMDILNK